MISQNLFFTVFWVINKLRLSSMISYGVYTISEPRISFGFFWSSPGLLRYYNCHIWHKEPKYDHFQSYNMPFMPHSRCLAQTGCQRLQLHELICVHDTTHYIIIRTSRILARICSCAYHVLYNYSKKFMTRIEI